MREGIHPEYHNDAVVKVHVEILLQQVPLKGAKSRNML